MDRPDGLLDDEEIAAMISVRFSPGLPLTVDEEPSPGAHRPSVVQRHAYARWAERADSVGFPIAGPEMILAVTQTRLLVWRPAFLRSRPQRYAGSIPLARIQSVGVHRRVFTTVLVLLFEEGTLIGVESMRRSRLRQFASAIPSSTD